MKEIFLPIILSVVAGLITAFVTKQLNQNKKYIVIVAIIFFLLGLILSKIWLMPNNIELIILSRAPDNVEWGKQISSMSSGKISYSKRSRGAIRGEAELTNLLPNNTYILSVNATKDHPYNIKLPEDCNGERCFNFKQFTTDANGYSKENFDIALSRGNYKVRFFVKDINDSKVVLYNDIFIFSID